MGGNVEPLPVSVTATPAGDPEPVRLRATNVLVEAKLHPPAPPAGTIVRPRLLDPLLARDTPPVVAVIAGPGYGKTTLLAQWAARAAAGTAWLTIDDLDNDPSVLVSHLDAALDACTSTGRSNGAASDRRGSRGRRPGIVPFLERLHALRRPITFLFDDVHRLAGPSALDALAVLVDHLPVGVRVAIAARREPALPLARWRADRRLRDVGEAELALDEAETAAVAGAAGWSLDAEAVRTLLERTEGWAVAAYLAALAHDRNGQDASAADLTGRDRFIASYLRSEIRAGLAPEDADLLARTSVLESVTAEAAVALGDDESAALRLRAIARRGVLVHEVASSPVAYRYHNLLRQFLLEEMDRARPGATRELHAQAAAWYGSTGRPEIAVEHALLAGDHGSAAHHMTAALVETLSDGRAATVERWLSSLDDATYRAYPPLAALAGWTHLVAGRAEDADRMADVVEAAAFEGRCEDGARSFESHRAMLRAVMGRHGVADALANAEVAAAIEVDGPWRANALWLLGSLRWLAGDVAGAEATLEQAPEEPPTAMSANALTKRAAIRLRAGDWRAAEALVDESLGALRGSSWGPVVSSFFVHAVHARVAIARGDLATGRAELVRAQLVRPTASHAAPWLSVDALLELARAYLAASDPGGAQTALREAEAIIRVRPGLGVLVGELVDLRRRIGGAADALAGSSTLTSAELRVLPLLPTYLSFQDIADRLGISRNTVKTHAMSIYGKLWASSRGEAVERAVELGLLEPYPGLDGVRRAGSDRLEGEEAG